MSKLNFIKKSICLFILAFAVLFAQVGLIFANFNGIDKVFAAYQPEPETTLTNGNFGANADATSYPQKPSNWESTSDSSSDTSVRAGVIPTDGKFATYKEDINLTSNPARSGDDSEKGVLMIQAKSGETKYGYKNTSSVSFDKNSFYKVSVWARTIDSNSASIYTNLTDSQNTETNFIEFTTAQNQWATYTFFVQTKTYEDSKFEIELWLGSKNNSASGTVLFDDITVQKITHAQYYADGVLTYKNNMEKDGKSTVRVIDLKSANVVNYSTDLNPTINIKNGDFETYTAGATEGFKLAPNSTTEKDATATIKPVDTIHDQLKKDKHIDSSTNRDIANNLMYSNNNGGHALLISNVERAVMGYESTTNFTIAQHQYYKISAYVKTGNLSNGGATITLTQRLTEEEIEAGKKPFTESITDIDTSSNNLPQYNGFQEYSFYVYGNPYRDVELYITFSLGTTAEDGTKTAVSGFAIFDDVTMELISEKTYSDNASSKNSKTLACHNETDTSTILNGSFNFTANKNEVATYPLAPKNWKYSEEENTQSGIINVNEKHFEKNFVKYGLTAYDNPGPATTYPGAENDVKKSVNNVLMIRNEKTNASASFSSETFNLSSSTISTPSIIKVVVYVKTLNNSRASVSLQNNDGVSLVSINDISSKSVWTPYTLYLKGSCTSQTVKLVLSTDTKGYAFFDYVSYSTVTISEEGTTEEDIRNSTSSTTAYTDLLVDSFINYGKEINTNLYTPSTFVKQNDIPVGTYFGVVDTTYNPYNTKVETKLNENNNNVLMINNTAPLAFNAKSALTYSLNSGYYKVSVWIHTADITSEEENEDIGATIELKLKTPETDEDGVELENTNVFNKIVTNTEENNGWVEYSFYINAETSKEIQLVLGLGTEEALTQGYAFFDCISVADITEEDFTKATEEKENNCIKTVVFKSETDNNTPEEEKPETETTTPAETNYWLIIPSIILGVTLLVAIGGYAFKKVPFRKYGKRNRIDKEYDRKTIGEENVKKELKQEREKKVAELDAKIAEIEKQITDDKKRYESLISKEDNAEKRDKLFTTYAKERARNQKQLENLNTAKTFLLDPANIKAEEAKEIKRRRKALEEENRQKQKELLKILNEPQEEVKETPKKKSKR